MNRDNIIMIIIIIHIIFNNRIFIQVVTDIPILIIIIINIIIINLNIYHKVV